MRKPGGYLECRCGDCRITLCDPTPRFRVECLCYDCRQRLLISASRRIENAPSAEFTAYRRGVDLMYFANALIVDPPSRNLLEFTKLREDAFNTTAMSKCCATLMCGVPPAFKEASIWATPNSCNIVVETDMEPRSYLFGCDFPAEKCAELPRHQNIPIVFSVFDEMDSAPVVELLSAIRAPLRQAFTPTDYTTFERLSADEPLAIDNACFDESRRGYTP